MNKNAEIQSLTTSVSPCFFICLYFWVAVFLKCPLEVVRTHADVFRHFFQFRLLLPVFLDETDGGCDALIVQLLLCLHKLFRLIRQSYNLSAKFTTRKLRLFSCPFLLVMNIVINQSLIVENDTHNLLIYPSICFISKRLSLLISYPLMVNNQLRKS